MSTASSESAIKYDQHGQPLDDLTRRGLALYEGRLKSFLEPVHTVEGTIHLDTGNHTVASSSPDAKYAMRRLHPQGLLFLYTISTATDHGLARRMTLLGRGYVTSDDD